MKALIIFLVIFAVSNQESPKLSGKYRIEYDKNYGLQLFEIAFADSIYTKRMPDAVTSKGKIKYEKYTITLRKDIDEDPMVIDTRDIGKDTMKFTVKSKADLSRNLRYGKMIRVR